MRLKSVLAIASLLSVVGAPTAQAAGCSIKELQKLFGRDEVSKTLFVRYRSFNPGAQKGVVAILGHASPDLGGQVVDDILEIFQPPVRNENPFGGDEGIFEAIGDFTEQVGSDLVMPPGMEKTIRELANRGAGDDDGVLFFQGAVFDLFTAKSLRSEGQLVTEFQKELRLLDANGATIVRREADLITRCDECAGGFRQIENKNWSSAVTVASDPRLVSLASQFKRDILLHAGDGMLSWRLNLREATRGSRDLIRGELLKQFDDPLVVGNLEAEALQAARESFETLWDEGVIVKFY